MAGEPSKYRAYRAPTGRDSVTAWSVAKERDELYRGEPTGQTFYSTHPEGWRKPMSHVYPRDGRAPFFRFVNSSDEGVGGPGESLEHMLFKEAIALAARTRLSLAGLGDHRILITNAETEKKILRDGGEYAADVHLRFESDTSLGMKWSGELYVEIHKEHFVDAAKIDAIRRLRLAMVEVSIPKSLLYEYGQEGTTDAREEGYRQRIKRMLESERGFLQAVVLSNPSSVEYLEAELAKANKSQQVADSNIKAAHAQIESMRAYQVRLSNQLAREQAMVISLGSEVTKANQLWSQKVDEVRALESELKGANQAAAALEERCTKLAVAVGAFGVAVAGAMLYAAYATFMAA